MSLSGRVYPSANNLPGWRSQGFRAQKTGMKADGVFREGEKDSQPVGKKLYL